MMKKLLKNSMFLLALSLAFVANAQVGFTYVTKPAQFRPTGELSEPLVMKLTNVPLTATNAVNFRLMLYPNGPALTNNNISWTNATARMLFEFGLIGDADVDNTYYSTVKTLNSDGTTFNKTFTIKNFAYDYNSSTTSGTGGGIVDGSYYCPNFRIVQGGSTGTAPLTVDAETDAQSPDAYTAHWVFSYYPPEQNETYGIYPNMLANSSLAILSAKEFENIASSIYPNPVKSTLYIKNSIESKTYKIFNVLGKTVFETNATAKSIDVSGLPSGLYILKTDSGFAKFIKQ